MTNVNDRGARVSPTAHKALRLTILLAIATASCFDFTATLEGDIGGVCGDVDHYCAPDLSCEERVCLRPGGSAVGDPCSVRIACEQALACVGGFCAQCDAGFVPEGTACVGTSGAPCSDVRTCRSGLVCNLGFCAEQCSAVLCVGGNVCDRGQNPPVCACPAGSHADEARCVSDCVPEACTGHGVCSVSDGSATCECDEGYVVDNENLVCSEPGCQPVSRSVRVCFDGDAYWGDGCGARESTPIEDCGSRGCTNGSCNPTRWVSRDVTFAGLQFNSAHFAMTSAGRPIAAVYGYTTADFALKQWTGAAWAALDMADGTNGMKPNSDICGLEVNGSDEVCILFGSASYLEGGTVWGTPDAPETVSDQDCAGLALDASGVPQVALFAHPSGVLSQSVFYRRADGGAWGGVGGSDSGTGLSGDGFATDVVIGATSDGEPILGWYFSVPGDSASTRLEAVRYVRGSWSKFFQLDVGSGYGPGLGLAIAGRKLALVWNAEETITVRFWQDGLDASSFDTTVTTRSAADVILGRASIAFDAAARPAVVWTERPSSGSTSAIYVRRFEDSAWRALGTTTTGASADSGAGIGQGYQSSGTPQLRIRGEHACIGWTLGNNQQTFAMQCADL